MLSNKMICLEKQTLIIILHIKSNMNILKHLKQFTNFSYNHENKKRINVLYLLLLSLTILLVKEKKMKYMCD